MMSDLNVSGGYAPPVQTPDPGAADATRRTGVTAPAVGTGTIGGVAQTPDVQAGTAQVPVGAEAAVASLFSMIPQITGQALDVLLLAVTSKLKDTISKSEQDGIETNTNAKRQQIAEKAEKLKEAMAKIEEAQSKLKDLSVWDKVKLAFQYVGAIAAIIGGVLAIAAGVAATATGVGSPAGIAAIVGGVLLITSGVMMLYQAADATYAATNPDGLGFAGAAEKDRLMNEGTSEADALIQARKTDMTAKIVIGAISAAFALAGAILTLPLGAATGFAAANAIKTAINVASGVSQVATGTGDIVVAVERNDANQTQADGMNTQAEGKAMEALIQAIDDMIDMALARLKGAGESFNAMLDALTDAVKDRGDSLSRVGLRA